MTTNPPSDQKPTARMPYFSTFQIILLSLLAALIVVAKLALRLPVRLPGHSGLFWMAILIVAAGIVPRRGAASLVGVISGVIAAFLGLGDHGALDTFVSYTMVGVTTDLALLLLRTPENSPDNLLVAVLPAIIGHLGKFFVKWVFGVISGVPVGFVTLGLAWSAVGYVVWGGLGGLLGWLTLKALHRAGFFAYLAEKR